MTIAVDPAVRAGFAALGVPAVLTAALAREGIDEPFPIQAATLPDCLSGRDVCGKAPTGSGKTLAFGLGVLARLAAGGAPPRRRRQSPTALILVPTRELASQVEDVLRPLAHSIGAKVASVFGGVGYGKQLAALSRGADVLVACPGRLEDLVARGSVDLSFVDMVVIDEADRMADMGFLPAVRRLVDRTQPDRQTLLFSATLDGPVDKLIKEYQRSPIRHDVALDETDQGEVHHHFWSVAPDARVAVTAEAVAARGPALVFCRTKRGADRLCERLAKYGLETAAIHGDRRQSQRERALADFRAGHLDVLVATDVAARGIHVDSVPLVVHFDPPADSSDYVHRSGRTGRAGLDGIVVSLIGHAHVGDTRRMQKKLGLKAGVSEPDVAGLPAVPGFERVPRRRNARPEAARPRSRHGAHKPPHSPRRRPGPR